ncbi:MAG: hypothetical protein CM15mP58_15550 [Burkholderiaceae bacterium]|nr:MAG: hypothetical protein CM15mP58_15550 [Burkholderiaceae bacterium]
MKEKKTHRKLSRGYCSTRSGIGTLDELLSIYGQKIQLGVENKILILVDFNSYLPKLLLFLRHVVDEEFLSKEQLSNTKICQNLK